MRISKSRSARMSAFAVCATLMAVAAAPAFSQARPGAARPAEPARDGQHDFDFEFGTWKTHLSRLLHPLTGSRTWVEYEGTSVVRKVWNGRANLAELEAHGRAGRLEVLSLRLYNPDAHQWGLNITSSASGVLSPAAVGEFRNGRGDFVDEEVIGGRTILVRFEISDVTPKTYRVEQAFSQDAGRTWEVNLIITATKVASD